MSNRALVLMRLHAFVKEGNVVKRVVVGNCLHYLLDIDVSEGGREGGREGGLRRRERERASSHCMQLTNIAYHKFTQIKPQFVSITCNCTITYNHPTPCQNKPHFGPHRLQLYHGLPSDDQNLCDLTSSSLDSHFALPDCYLLLRIEPTSEVLSPDFYIFII